MFRLLAERSGQQTRTDLERGRFLLFSEHGRHFAVDGDSLTIAEVDEKLYSVLESRRGARARRIIPACPTPQQVGKVVLIPTMDCNLACSYCFASTRPQAIMSRSVAERAIERFFPSGPADISFFGGEPFLAWDLVQHVERITRDRARKLHVTTNGTLFNAERVAFMRDCDMSILVSLDGPRHIHDVNRPTRGGSGSWVSVIRGLELCRSAGLRVMARGTFTLDNVQMAARLRFYEWARGEGLIESFSLEPAVLSEGCARHRPGPVDWPLVEREYHLAAQWYLEHGPGFFHFDLMLKRLSECRAIGRECGAGWGYVTVGPDGQVYACHRLEPSQVGSLDRWDDVARTAWRGGERRHCELCPVSPWCGGGCRHTALEDGDIDQPSGQSCRVMRLLVRESLWLLSAQRDSRDAQTQLSSSRG